MNRRLPLELALFFGFGLVWPSSSLANIISSSVKGGMWVIDPRLALAAGGVSAAVLLVVMRDSLFPLSEKPRWYLYAVGAAVVSCGAVSMPGYVDSSFAGFTAWVFFFILGACFALLSCAWLELISRLNLRYAALAICGSHAVVALSAFAVVCLLSTTTGMALSIAAFLLISAFAYFRALKLGPEKLFGGAEAVSASWKFSARPVAVVALFALSTSLIRQGLDSEVTNYGRLGVIALSLLLFFLYFFSFDKVKGGVLAGVALECVMAAVFCRLAVFPGSGLMATMLVNLSYALFFIFAHIMMSQLSYRFGVNPLLLFGSTYAAIAAASWLGSMFGAYSLGMSETMYSVVCIVVLLVLTGVLLASMRVNDSFEVWGVESKELAGTGAEMNRDALLREKCMIIAHAYSLTRREEEMLLYLAQGVAFADIEKELVVSRATVKTHVQHTYEKLGVHSRSEAAEFVENYAI